MPRPLKTEVDLFNDQRRFVQEICEKKTVYLALMMGTGKTVIGLTAAKQLLESWRAVQVLVVAPMRVAESTWPDEIREWEHLRDLEFSVITGTPEARERAARQRVPIHIVNRENVVWLRRFWGDDWPYDVLLYDEASRLKGGRKKTKPAKKARKDGGLPKPQLSEFGALCAVRPKLEFIVEFSGTPNPNGLPDLWGPMYLLDGGERLGRTRTAFLDRWFIKGFNGWSYEPRDGAFREIAGRVRDIMLSAPDPMSDTPISKAVYATLPPKVQAEYHKFRRTLVAEPWDVRASSAGVLANKLLQFANGSLYDGSRAARFVHDEKLNALESIIEEAGGEPVLVFYGFQFDKAAICKRFKQAEVFGKDPTFVARWNAGKIPLAIAYPGSAGHGLNLQYGGRIAVWYGLTWNLEYYLQANKRLHRRGQTRTVYLYHILARGTINERVYGLLPEKARTQNRLLQATIADFIRARTGDAEVSPMEFDLLEREAAQEAILKEFLAEIKAG